MSHRALSDESTKCRPQQIVARRIDLPVQVIQARTLVMPSAALAVWLIVGWMARWA